MPLDPRQVTAVVVTRGDVDLERVLASIPFPVVVWDNSREIDVKVLGRYAAIVEHVRTPVAYVQDDDAVLDPEAFDILLAAYQPGHLIANMPERFRPHYPDSCLVGFGALFDRGLPQLAFRRFRVKHGDGWPDGEVFRRTCDVVFSALTPRILVDAPYRDRPYAHAPNRMWKSPGHYGERQRVLELARQAR